jgi:hypothetical protein
MLQKYFLLCLFLISGFASFAQGFGTVKGTAKDSSGRKLDFITVVVYEDQKYATSTDNSGNYSLQVPANENLTLVFSSINTLPARQKFIIGPNQTMVINPVLTARQNNLDSALIKAKRTDIAASTVEVRAQGELAAPNESFEANLAFQSLGVSKTNELSSNYSVRGGNFDENLVYVNDFEIYRPYLIRSAEQEGLSFVNPDMVDNVKFSSGGFQARYGDKMSSVMDVTYRRPDSLSGSFYASLLGYGAHLEGTDKKNRFAFSVGVRQRTSQYLLTSLDTKGQYSPNFLDVQALLTYRISEKLGLEALVNYSRNQYTFIPVDRSTTFGVLTNVLNLDVYYNGQEADLYQSSTDGIALVYDPTPDVHIKFLGSYVLDREKEAFDITGQYYLGQVQSNLGASNFGQVLYALGSGGIQNWGRDNLSMNVYTAATRGTWIKGHHNVMWGADYKREMVTDQISQWNYLDSAGYSVPYTQTINYNNPINPFTRDTLNLNNVLKSNNALNGNRLSFFIQDTWQFGSSEQQNRFTFNYGLRMQYYSVNKEIPVPTPRAQFSWKPKGKKDIVVTAATGLYYQPPSFREMLNSFTGVLNTSMKAQKSFHAILGFDYAFKAWGRPFDFTTEAYYKNMWALDPYQYSDDLIQYLGNNSAVGYAYGLDTRLHGELAKGLESFLTISVMKTAMKIGGASYEEYFDSANNQIPYSADNLPLIKDSTKVHPGYFPSPTDQRVNFNLYFQDYIPKFPFIKIHINLVFATGLPFGPPGENFYDNTLRMTPYERVDIGFSGQLWTPKWAKKPNKFNQGLKSVWISAEVFNVFNFDNVVSYLWVADYSGDQYAVPNYLSSRRVNVKVAFKF